MFSSVQCNLCVSYFSSPAGTDYKIDGGNAFMWMRGDGGDVGIRSLNFQSPGVGPWAQQRHEPLLGNNHDHYQAMAAAALQDDVLRQQFMPYQQPFQFPQQPCVTSPLLQQQIIQQAQIINAQSHCTSENQTHNIMNQQLQQPYNEQQKVHQPQNFSEAFQIPSSHIEKHQSPFPAMSQKLRFSDSNTNFTSVLSSNCGPNVMSHGYSEGSSNVLDFSSLGQPMMNEHHQHSWEPKLTSSQVAQFGSTVLLPPFPGKDGSLEAENCRAEMQNHTLFGANIDSSNILSNAVPSLMSSSAVDADVSTVPYAGSYVQNPLYGSVDESSSTMHSAGEADPTTRTFVKVWTEKSALLPGLFNFFKLKECAFLHYCRYTSLDRLEDRWTLVVLAIMRN